MAKRITSKDIAALAGVSRTTVSFVLNDVEGVRIPEETRQRVLDVARQLNYHPDAAARRMVSGRAHVIGLVLRQSTEEVFSDHFLPRVLQGLAQSAAGFGYRTLFEPLPPSQEERVYTALMRERHVDGLIVSGPRVDDQDLTRIFSAGEPVVLMGQLPSTHIPFVDVDNHVSAMRATEHLLSLGHRRIGLITNAPLVYTASADRLRGYRDALQAAGIAYDETLVRYGGFSPQSGESAMIELLDEKPSAVFVASDTVAMGALRALRSRGVRVPDDLALMGFDDIPLSEFIDPPLSTVRLPAFELGWNAAEKLIGLIDGDASARENTLLDTELVIRESCGAQLNSQRR
jgi:LacI family transcriptional regulator